MKLSNCYTLSLQNRAHSAVYGLSVLFLLAGAVANATSILQLSFDELVSKSTLVFEGEVVTSEARWNENRTEIYTTVIFSVSDVIKGQLDSNTLTLSFAGGRVGPDNVAIQALIYPKVGEAGIYFVERTDIDMVNPLLGWSQGHFVVEGDKVMTNQHQKVIGIDSVSAEQKGEMSLSSGNIKGLRTSKSEETDTSAGLNTEQFKQLIRGQLK